LVIGMTNRKELIDEALLRPGRLEVHMEINLPNEQGRLEIFNIHTAKIRSNKFLSSDVIIKKLAETTKNFSGAEIEGLVNSATSFAFNRQIDPNNLTKPIDPNAIRITKADFDFALKEVKPAFGISEDEFEAVLRNGIINFGPTCSKILDAGKMFAQQVLKSARTPVMSVLLEGPPGCGKTALAAKMATDSGFPYVKLLSPEVLVGYSEVGKCTKIAKFFDDAYKSPLSVIVVDDIERILEYVRIGPRFSNAIMQTLLVYFKKVPPKDKKLLIIGTTSQPALLKELDIYDAFNATLKVPNIKTEQEFINVLSELDFLDENQIKQVVPALGNGINIGIKKLLLIVEMAKQVDQGNALEQFISYITEYGISNNTSIDI